MVRRMNAGSPDRDARRLAAFTGLAAMAAWVIAFVLSTSLSVDSPAARLAAYFDAHSARLLVCLVLFEIGAALLVGFFVGLWYLHREADPSVGALAAVGAAGGIATQVVVLMGMGLSQVAVISAMRGGDPEMIKTLEQGSWVMFAVSGVPTVVFATAIALSMLRTGVPGRWAGWLGLLVAVVHIPAALSLAQSGAFGLDGLFANLAPLVFMVWVVATCVPLARREGARLVPPEPAQEDAIHPTA
jgi:hypothetical protein